MTAAETTVPTTETARNRPFNPWRVPASEDARRLCAYVQQTVEAYEQENTLRGRRRDRKEQEVFTRAIAALACDLLHHAVAFVKTGRGKSAVTSQDSILVSLSNRHLGTADPSRSPVMSKALPDIVKRMAACGFLYMQLGHGGSVGFEIPPEQTGIRPTRLLIDLAIGRKKGVNGETFKITGFEDFAFDNSKREPIILRAPKIRKGKKVIRQGIAYRENSQTKKLRAEMTAINEWLAQAPLTLDRSILTDVQSHPLVDPADRFINRIFTNGSFDSGGRLYGGFWQYMSKKERIVGITIAGEKVCILDYSQMGPRIVYALAGVKPPSRDCYNIPGQYHSRDAIKQIFNAAFFQDHVTNRFPAYTKQYFGPGVRFADVRDAFLETHSPIREYLFSPVLIGHKQQNIESRIMVDVLLSLKETGLPAALPIHDAIVVPVSHSMTTRDAMQEAFYKHTGMDALIHMEEEHRGA